MENCLDTSGESSTFAPQKVMSVRKPDQYSPPVHKPG